MDAVEAAMKETKKKKRDDEHFVFLLCSAQVLPHVMLSTRLSFSPNVCLDDGIIHAVVQSTSKAFLFPSSLPALEAPV